MRHLDPDRLVLLALAEDTAEPDETAHLTGCGQCRDELDALEHVARAGAESGGMRDLPPPPDRVWDAIQAGLAPVPAPVRVKARRRLSPVLAAVAAAVLAVAGTLVVQRVTAPAPEAVTARAALAPLADAPASAGGAAEVRADGEMLVDVTNLPLTTGFHEVWLIDPDDLTRMVSLGNLPDGRQAVLPVPPGTDLNRYRLVDISDEAHDGDAAHSGKSLLRGVLTS
ncbi:anti-sigma factor [Actinoplanes sp. NPDC051494]|uniref:anti-sigma factor n=1 Tax=Actinoplanes sp. NPDC051494 TaxID=3363907 RepID=UPI0037A818A1